MQPYRVGSLDGKADPHVVKTIYDVVALLNRALAPATSPVATAASAVAAGGASPASAAPTGTAPASGGTTPSGLLTQVQLAQVQQALSATGSNPLDLNLGQGGLPPSPNDPSEFLEGTAPPRWAKVSTETIGAADEDFAFFMGA